VEIHYSAYSDVNRWHTSRTTLERITTLSVDVLTIYRALERVASPDCSCDTLLRALPYVVVVSIYIRISVVSAAVGIVGNRRERGVIKVRSLRRSIVLADYLLLLSVSINILFLQFKRLWLDSFAEL
jgi:hypothetical protein